MKYSEHVMNTNQRCIQSICDIADSVHEGQYTKTVSLVLDIPQEYNQHVGVFIINESNLVDYINKFNPVILRNTVTSGQKYLPKNSSTINFGASKGLTFNRVLIITTDKQLKFLKEYSN